LVHGTQGTTQIFYLPYRSGFAYYAEGDFDRANQAWFDALYLTEETKETAQASGSTAKKEALTIYAGLAMGLRQSAQSNQPLNAGAYSVNRLNYAKK
jgi:hypothetical protein